MTKGGDFDHPMGASTTRPGTNANGFTSFQAVLEAEFPLTLDYNPWVIGGPLPWGVKQQVFAPTITRTNADICNKLAAEQAAATLAGKTVLQHLIDKYGASAVTITAEELDELQEGCTNCRFLLDEPITLPVFLDAKSEGCISRTSFNTAKSTFVNLFGSTTTDPNHTEVYKNYMNRRFGMVLTYADYLAFDGGTGEYLCNEVVEDPIAGDPYGCANEMMGVAIINAKRGYEDYIAEIKRDFQQKYVSTCMALQSKIGFQKAESYNAITLYYYDNAGNLLKTITPKDFRRVNESLWANVDLIRNGAPITPSLQPSFAPHMAATSYYYNSLNGVTAQYTPDADLSNFWYDTKGRLFASQNKEQHSPTTVDGVTLPADRYSYTQYDALGRIVVVGEQSGKTLTGVLNNSFVQESDITAFFNGGTKKSVTRTFYDTETGVAGHPWYNAGLQGNLHNLRKRVVASTYQETENSTIEQATYYSYDLMGNVKSVWQRLLGLPEFKRTDYQFELTSGKTTGVLYQDGKTDAFYHQYEYDAENRVKAVYTNTQKTTSAGLLSLINAPGTVKDANYQYYPHGPLSRTELGGNLQGLDYAYTLQGWLKTLNGQDLNASKDMGRDGESGTGLHAGFSRDVLAYTIGYFIGDYSPINGSNFIRPFSHNGVSGLRGVSQYNGNISHATYANKGLGDGTNIVGYLYAYRQLNVLAGRNFHTISSSLNSWHDNTGTTQKYRESYNTDVNGNIITIIRNGDNPNDGFKMDDLRLEYNGNKLDYVRELYTNSAAYENDLEHQAAGNYTYDKIGNLVKDVDGGLTGVYWNVYGKIAEIRKAGTVMKYRYDASGNRVYKETIESGVTKSTWYVRDAQGNVLTTYDASGGTPLVKESYIYGSSRLGLYRWIPGAPGKRSYEISNYLGNVMATIGEAQMPVGGGSLIDYYDADIETATDYYSYGMVMPDRESNVEGYRMGFNGKENDNEVKGTGNQQDYGMRIYDPRIARFLSVDPLTQSYPWYTPYQFAGNMPIRYVDLDGGEPAEPGSKIGEQQTGTNGAGPATSWEWNGSLWQEASLSEVVVTPNIFSVGNAKLNSKDDDLSKTYHPRQSINTRLFDPNRPYDRTSIDKHLNRLQTAFSMGTIANGVEAQNEASSLLLNFQTGKGKPMSFGSQHQMSKILSKDGQFVEMAEAFEANAISYLRTRGSLVGFNGNVSIAKARKGKYMRGTLFMFTVMGGFQQVTAQISIVGDKEILFKYTVWDHFGAGKDDATSPLPALPSLYWLQHNSANNNILMHDWFTPFIWNIKVDRTIKY